MPTNGNDTLVGTAGNDSINGLAGDDSIEGLAGNDTLGGGAGNDTLVGGDGDDQLADYEGTNTVRGGAGNDGITLTGTGGLIELGDGQDGVLIWSWATGRFVVADFAPGVDQVWVNGMNASALAQTTNIDLDGDGLADDTRWSLGALTIDLLNYVPATISNAAGHAFVAGTPFNDTILGSSGAETINGIGGLDWLDGSGGNDRLVAYAGGTLIGGAGDDTLAAGPSGTTFIGGAGRDSVEFGPWFNLPGQTSPTIVGFVVGEDQLQFESAIVSVRMGLDLDNDGFADDALATSANNQTVVFLDPVVAPFIGGDGPDLLKGSIFDDTLLGGAGADTLLGSTGVNVMSGGSGADVFDLSGSSGTAVLLDYDPFLDRIIATPTYAVTGVDLDGDGQLDDGWFGSSTFAAAVLNLNLPSVTGGVGAETLTGTVFGDTINGAGGGDWLDGSFGNDVLNGDPGNDFLFGSQGDDTLNGGTGEDSFSGGVGSNLLSGDAGHDSFFLRFGTDTVFGGTGRDSVYLGDFYITQSEPGGEAVVNTGDDDDAVFVARGRATIDGGAGNDLIQYGIMSFDGEGNQHIWPRTFDFFDVKADGGPGVDKLGIFDYGISSYLNFATGQLFMGAQGVFTITGIEVIQLNGSTTSGDTIVGWTGLIEARLGRGNDWIADYSSANNDRFFGEGGDDALWGLGGNDVLDGDWGHDTISGGDGDDTLIGGEGGDWMHGGIGADVFRYLAVGDAALTGPLDVAAGFEIGIDKLDLAAIDANATLAGDQAFTVGALQAGIAGRLSIELAANLAGGEQLWVVRGDVNGDGAADLQIWVAGGGGNLGGGDFVL